jgi:hypothetical protein
LTGETTNSLKLVSAVRNKGITPVQQRRNKLSTKLYEQIQLAEAQAEGRTYAPSKLKTLVNKETGERTTVEATKRIKQWWWVGGNGKIALSVRYGAKAIELAKGKNAIELDSVDSILPALQVLKQAVEAGELDTAIEAVSGAVKSHFKK